MGGRRDLITPKLRGQHDHHPADETFRLTASSSILRAICSISSLVSGRDLSSRMATSVTRSRKDSRSDLGSGTSFR